MPRIFSLIPHPTCYTYSSPTMGQLGFIDSLQHTKSLQRSSGKPRSCSCFGPGRSSANLNNGHVAAVVNAPNTPTFQGEINGNLVDKDVSWHFSPKNGQHLPISLHPCFRRKNKTPKRWRWSLTFIPCHGLETHQKQRMAAYEAIKEHIIAVCIIVYPAFNKTNNIE